MSRERAQAKIDEWFVGVTEQAFRAAVDVNADLTEVTVVVTRKRGDSSNPPSMPLTEVVEAVAQHQAAGFSPSTDADSIAKAADADKGRA